MTAKEIPNLRELLGPRRGGLSRDRGRGRGGPGSPREGAEALKDNAVRGTDQDAAGSRASCVELGYLHDPYAKLFATQTTTRRLPLLNRGTYVRTSAIDLLVDKFLNTSPDTPKQIVSLGAGTDTRYFRLRDRYPETRIVYHELDFPTNTAAKLASIQRHAQLHEKLTSKPPPNPLTLDQTATSYFSETYNLHAIDLRSLTSTTDNVTIPSLPNLDPTLPTLILSEMCLVYLKAATVSSILQTFLEKYLPSPTPVSLILYEPILPNDAFGRTMISNLSTRNIHLPTLLAYPDLGDQRARLRSYGFVDGARAADTEWIWKEWVTEEEKERVGALEMLDELEELEMLLRHYCVAWGWRDGGGEGVFTKAWDDVAERR
ncbi:leucine carboxyl methyltransferase 1 [Lophiostoma macrostomum CBS 122681]|uniref:Leucine carboxyl methyltransferase 1 n=1 Tax=Lophiostoma macrostomum CBS 122681 TaxID=1314788 RepID=A0A6A6T9M4_9PLEO|nr:leucine carboxyl methyltransferase 1 [Lophiostoma macrostomum CBS 122681]